MPDRRRLRRYMLYSLAGWVVLMLAIAGWVLLKSTEPTFHPEAGAPVLFVVLAGFYSIYYVLAILLVGAMFWCLRDSLRWRARRLQGKRRNG